MVDGVLLAIGGQKSCFEDYESDDEMYESEYEDYEKDNGYEQHEDYEHYQKDDKRKVDSDRHTTKGIYAFNHDNQKWEHVVDMPFKCSFASVLQSQENMYIIDGQSSRFVKITVQGKSCKLYGRQTNQNIFRSGYFFL